MVVGPREGGDNRVSIAFADATAQQPCRSYCFGSFTQDERYLHQSRRCRQGFGEIARRFLKEAIGVPAAAIFCSSVKGHHIPFGEDFNSYIKEQIQEPKLVILLMTPAYMEKLVLPDGTERRMGAGLEQLAVVVEPIGFEMLGLS